MARKKILVCNALSFVMANFIRYLIYHTKEFDVVSIGEVNDVSSLKKRYVNQYNSFYAGKIEDLDFLKQVAMIESPDIIINGFEYEGPHKTVVGSWNLSQLGLPVIQLTRSIWEHDPNGWWQSVASTTINNSGYIIETPNIFGRWQNPNEGLAKIVKNVTTKNKVDVIGFKLPWIYVGDLCSFMWYVIEKVLENNVDLPKHIKCPISLEMLGTEVALAAGKIFKIEIEMNEKGNDPSYTKSFEPSNMAGWEPDDVNAWKLVENTIGWYRKNQWALCL